MKSNKNAKIYVAGHTGLVGSSIFNNLKLAGYNNLIVRDLGELDLRRQADIEDFFSKEKPDYVFLAAAKVGGIIANNTYKAEFIYDNLLIASNVINSAYKFGVKKLLNLGSSCIYPKLATQPLKEEYLLTGALEPTNEPYAIAKIAAIKLCRYYNEQYGTDFISFMPTNLYGRHDNYNFETSHVLPALIRKMILAKALNEKDFDFIIKDIQRYKLGFNLDNEIDFNNNDSILEVLSKLGIKQEGVILWGTGEVKREFLHVDDMSQACIHFMENYSYNEIGEFINIGTGKDITIKELAYLINEITNFKGDIKFDSTKPDGTPQKLLDVGKARALGWEAKISLEDGVSKVITNYLASD